MKPVKNKPSAAAWRDGPGSNNGPIGVSSKTNRSVEVAIRAIARGEMIVVVDDQDRENEGDLIMAASKATAEQVAFMIRHTSGILCVPLSAHRARELRLNPMVTNNDSPFETAFTVSVDYRDRLTTGISATERGTTARALSDRAAQASDFVRPGHMFPLIGKDGGVLARRGRRQLMHELTINYWAVVVAAMSRVIVAKLWFGRPFVIRAWAAAHVGLDGSKRNVRLGEALELATSLVIAVALACATGFAEANTIGVGIAIAVGAWLAFIFASQSVGLVWDMRQPRYFLIAQVYQLASFIIMGAILGGWS